MLDRSAVRIGDSLSRLAVCVALVAGSLALAAAPANPDHHAPPLTQTDPVVPITQQTGPAEHAIIPGLILLFLASTMWFRRQARHARALQSAPTDDQILSQIVRRTTNMVMVMDHAFHIEWVNEGFTRVTGYQLSEVVGKTPPALLHCEKTNAQTVAQIHETLGTRRIFHGHILHRAKNGREYWLELEITPRVDHAGEHIGFMAIGSDISSLVQAREQAERALMEQQRLSTVVNEHTLFSITDRAGTILEVNEGFCRISGYTRDELVGRTHRVVNSGYHPKSFWKDMWRTIAAGRVWRGEVCNRAKDGSLYWVDSTNIPQRDAQGNIERYISLRFDITDKKRAQERLALAMRSANVGLWDWDLASGETYFSDTFYTMLGYEPAELPMHVDSWEKLVHPDDRDATWDAVRNHLDGRTPAYTSEHRLQSKDGNWLWIHDAGEIVERHEDGSPKRMIGVHVDISAIKAVEQTLHDSEERYALAVRGSRDGIWDWNLRTNKVYYAPRWKELLGITDTDMRDSPDEWFRRIASSSLTAFHQQLTDHIEGRTDSFDVELEMGHADGDTRWMLCRAAAIRDEHGKAVRLAGSLADITQLKRTQQELRRMAHHDSLTDLPNRAVLTARVEQALACSRRDPQHRFALLFFDFDRFKVVNDGAGHSIGDALLVSIANRFRKHIRETDVAARFGGDEFVVLLDDIEGIEEAQQASQRLLNVFAQPHEIQGHEIVTTASIGVVSSEDGYKRAEDMIRDADAAMYHAKAAGRANFCVFDEAMHTQALECLSLEQQLRRQAFDEEFEVLYQPVVSLQTGRVAGFEALLRWNHPTRGVISPDQFINIAEETGLIVPLGQWVLKTACAQIARWRERVGGDRRFFVNVNISKRQLVHPNLLAILRETIIKANIRPEDLKLEVTETAIMDDRHDMIAVMNAIRDMGVHLAMDDFGTGHSSLSCLHRFPIKVLKIDRSFIINMERHREFAAVVQSIIALARNLNMDVVAEGIENQDQLAQLQALDCAYAQGYFFARPLSAANATNYLLQDDELARTA